MNFWTNPDKLIGFSAAIGFHAVLIFGSGQILTHQPEYGVEAGSGGMEVSLTAAPAEEIPSIEMIEPVIEEEASAEAISQTENKTSEEAQPSQVTAADSLNKGDGSSLIPGKDVTTFYSSAGAVTEAKPNYLQNPAPPYPREAREKGWEGTVILKILVDTSGKPIQTEIEQSSGYDILDRSAVKTVATWHFRPAQVGALPVESSVRIPIRFELENLKKR